MVRLRDVVGIWHWEILGHVTMIYFMGAVYLRLRMWSAWGAWLPEHVIKRCLIGLNWPHKNS